jgi:tRNA nucleotidyltransferase (CCA-adding enzyme)
MAAGFPEGPAMGDLLRSLLDAVLEDPRRNQRETLLELATSLSRRQARPDSHA